LEISSGGQTGVDRAAFDVALALGIPIGGWVPHGRRAEDGIVPIRYPGLREAASADYSVRTRLNVRDTDATLILSVGDVSGGTLETLHVARDLDRPLLQCDLQQNADRAAAEVSDWLEGLISERPCFRLNIAGPRASKAPTSYTLAHGLLHQVLTRYAPR
jgi:hypothetical protein